MALKFENSGTCLIVKQYLDRTREVLRQELLGKISDLLVDASTTPAGRPVPGVQTEELEVRKVNAF